MHDLGINVTVNQFIEAIRGQKADLLAMSALLTMSSTEQKEVIETLKEDGLLDKVKVMVGGGAIPKNLQIASGPMDTQQQHPLRPN